MIKFDKNEFLKPQIYSTLDEYETRCNVTEEIIKEIEQLQQENKHLDEVNYKLRKTNEQLKDNWNKLKEFIVKEFYMYLPLEASTKSITIIIDKMQELEQGSDSNENN